MVRISSKNNFHRSLFLFPYLELWITTGNAFHTTSKSIESTCSTQSHTECLQSCIYTHGHLIRYLSPNKKGAGFPRTKAACKGACAHCERATTLAERTSLSPSTHTHKRWRKNKPIYFCQSASIGVVLLQKSGKFISRFTTGKYQYKVVSTLYLCSSHRWCFR